MASKEFQDFLTVLGKNHVLFTEYPVLAVSVARDYVRCAGRLYVLYTDYCNRDLTASEVARMSELEAHAKKLSSALGFGLIVNHDPRAAVLKLILPSGTTNDFCSEGYYVPTSEGR